MTTGFYDFLRPAFSPFYDRTVIPGQLKKESLNQVNESAIGAYWKWTAFIPGGAAAIYFGSESPFKYLCVYCAAVCTYIAIADGKEILNAVSKCEEEYLFSLQNNSFRESSHLSALENTRYSP